MRPPNPFGDERYRPSNSGVGVLALNVVVVAWIRMDMTATNLAAHVRGAQYVPPRIFYSPWEPRGLLR